jgi:hypothetical protein
MLLERLGANRWRVGTIAQTLRIGILISLIMATVAPIAFIPDQSEEHGVGLGIGLGLIGLVVLGVLVYIWSRNYVQFNDQESQLIFAHRGVRTNIAYADLEIELPPETFFSRLECIAFVDRATGTIFESSIIAQGRWFARPPLLQLFVRAVKRRNILITSRT